MIDFKPIRIEDKELITTYFWHVGTGIAIFRL